MNYIARFARRTITHLLPRLARDVRCSGCGQPRTDQNSLVSGPGVYLCESCFRDVAEKIVPRTPPTDGTRCHFCRQVRAANDVGRAGSVTVCADCLGLMQSIFGEGRHRRAGDRGERS